MLNPSLEIESTPILDLSSMNSFVDANLTDTIKISLPKKFIALSTSDSYSTTEIVEETSRREPASKPKNRSKAKVHTSPKRSRATPESRAKFRNLTQKAASTSENLLACAIKGDIYNVANLANRLDEVLDEMWAMRDCRDDALFFNPILTHIQTAIKQSKIEGNFEYLTALQYQVFRDYIVELLGTREKTQDDLKKAVQLIKDAGFNPFFALSEPEQKK